MLWWMRHKTPGGVTRSVIDASDLGQAQAVGRAWVAEQTEPGNRFIQIDGPMIIAGPGILTKSSAPTTSHEADVEAVAE